MIVCKYCLQAIESHDGKQRKIEMESDDHRLDDNGFCICEWCGDETEYTELTEIL